MCMHLFEQPATPTSSARSTVRTSDESWDRKVLKKGGLVDRFAALVPLGQSGQVLVGQADHMELHVVAVAAGIIIIIPNTLRTNHRENREG